MQSILQISDLHRSNSDPIDNDTLLSVILADCDRFSTEFVSPSAIVVSGDLVQGVRVGSANWKEEMASQYETAKEFVSKLCDELIGGDRSQLAIVPGNHDICWNTSAAAMERVPIAEYPGDIRAALTGGNSVYRWSWKEMALYRIKNYADYENRLWAYWDFFETFYLDVNLPLKVDRSRGYHFFELLDRQVFLVGFDSTFGNDCLRYSGGLAEGVVGRCAMDMRKIRRSYELKMAVWHHSTYGPPHRDDYLDVNYVREMTGHGFQLGLHGHQHVAESAYETVSLGQGQSMAVVSAGSLCAGWNELPRGINRQYNLITLNENMASGHLHVREMIEGNQFTRKTNGPFLEGSLPLKWSPQLNALGQPNIAKDQNIRRIVELVERDLRNNQVSAFTTELLLAAPKPNSFERTILLQALVLGERWLDIFDYFAKPDSPDEMVAVIEAAIQLNRVEIAETYLKRSKLPDAIMADLRTRIQMKKVMG